MKIWVLTYEVNEHDQYGEYFLACWLEKPSLQDIMSIVTTDDLVHNPSTELGSHILPGGGRRDGEDQWFHLRHVEQGKTL